MPRSKQSNIPSVRKPLLRFACRDTSCAPQLLKEVAEAYHQEHTCHLFMSIWPSLITLKAALQKYLKVSVRTVLPGWV